MRKTRMSSNGLALFVLSGFGVLTVSSHVAAQQEIAPVRTQVAAAARSAASTSQLAAAPTPSGRVPLTDATGKVLGYVQIASGGGQRSIQFQDANGNPLWSSADTPAARGVSLPSLNRSDDPGDKADAADQRSIDRLQFQIDQLRKDFNAAIDKLNQASR